LDCAIIDSLCGRVTDGLGSVAQEQPRRIRAELVLNFRWDTEKAFPES
jgi:hypothetical protein